MNGELEAVVPVLERRHDRHVVGLEHVETGGEDVGQLPLVDEDRGLAFAHGQLGAVLDLVALALEAPDHRVAGVVGPVDDVDELAGQEVEDAHARALSLAHSGPAAIRSPVSSAAMTRTIGIASAAVMPGRSRGS